MGSDSRSRVENVGLRRESSPPQFGMDAGPCRLRTRPLRRPVGSGSGPDRILMADTLIAAISFSLVLITVPLAQMPAIGRWAQRSWPRRSVFVALAPDLVIADVLHPIVILPLTSSTMPLVFIPRGCISFAMLLVAIAWAGPELSMVGGRSGCSVTTLASFVTSAAMVPADCTLWSSLAVKWPIMYCQPRSSSKVMVMSACGLMGELISTLVHVVGHISLSALAQLSSGPCSLTHATGVHARLHRHNGSGDVRARLRWVRLILFTFSRACTAVSVRPSLGHAVDSGYASSCSVLFQLPQELSPR